ncbi:hypothetical protein [Roseinatronobacter monicus]|uniref:Uncharacterized protein n=1 Tax=Roseinatronobacter monicus TaxID=393481 RepID=A0A543K5P8_9RHOB|nr:hypothetical protein [Roseinatronobacter monicus]TQM90374.1 hypothetical protein BD293_3752 [Roseinatronobacter monicus]
MKRKLLLALLAGALIAFTSSFWIMTRDHSIRLVEMEYTEFKELAEQHLAPDYPDVSFSPPSTDFFQEMRQDPSGWSLLVRQLVVDPLVDMGTKAGASAALLDLPPDQLAEFLEFLLTRAYEDAEYMRIAINIAFNSYRGAIDVTPDMLPKGSIFDHSHRPAVRRVLQRMWEHPAYPERGDDYYGMDPLEELFLQR